VASAQFYDQYRAAINTRERERERERERKKLSEEYTVTLQSVNNLFKYI